MSEPEAQQDADRPGLRGWLRRHSLRLKVTSLVTALVLVYLSPAIFYSVYPGQAAVVWYRFAGGTDLDYIRQEGLRIKFPWDLSYLYNIRLQQAKKTYNVLTVDGARVEVGVAIRFRLFEEGLGALHKHVGPDYIETLILPEIGAQVRETISRYSPAELYSEQRRQIQSEILDRMTTGLLVDYRFGEEVERAIHVEDVLIHSIVLPPKVKEAIADKLTQQQRMLEYDYRLEKEEKERERKRIEAEGIRAFQDIVAEGISDRYLKWKGIDATLELARSANAKIVIIGAGDDGLPVILGPLDASSAPLGSSFGSPVAPPPATIGPSSAAPPASSAPPTDLPPRQ